ncbi:DMT family transporter [Halalkalibacter urbisdiaboli]|uniref:DMT family transporter n=1 Tax=Halalkalibacter urbisdiaboli TaxID=1960589 RepID=UPI000B45141C|nr:DMT family transporter [Halalkalibacter urbisdiaboli]
MSDYLKAHIQVTLAMIIIGSFVVVSKLIIERFPVFIASELRMVIGAAILTGLLLMREKRFPKLSKRDFFILFLQSLLGVFMFSVLMLYGLKLTTALESGIITSTTPAIVAIISYILFKEKLSLNQGAGILLAMIGAIVINVFGVISNTNWTINSLIGNLLILGAVIGEGIFFTFGKLVSSKISPLFITTMTAIIGAILFLPFSIYQASSFSFRFVTTIDWLLIAYSGVVVTVIAVLLMNQGMKRISGNSAAVLTAVMPISAVIFSYYFLNESLYWYHLVGISFVLAGIFFISKEPSTDIEADKQTRLSS